MNKRSLTAYLAARARRASARTPKAATFLDSVEAILSFEPADYLHLYGASSERALVFTRVSYGRSPMVFIRTYPIKPALVIYHQPRSVDPLAMKLAEVENIHFARTDLELEEVLSRVRESRSWLKEGIKLPQ